MIAIVRKETTAAQQAQLLAWLQEKGVQTQLLPTQDEIVLVLSGNTDGIDTELLAAWEIIEAVQGVAEPFKQCSRRFHPQSTVVQVGSVKIGGGAFCLIAGPCSVESEAQIIGIAEQVKKAGATLLRGGAFKPRTSPYEFQGLQAEGIRLLLAAKRATGLPIVTEIVRAEDIDLFADVDVLQVGARNMQNFALLKQLGKTNKPILLKRGAASTLHELLMSAEYLLSEGNHNVILCERGIRGFDSYTRNTLDLTAVPMLHELTHLPIVVDPSHATGRATLVPPMAMAAAACGADGVMTEVHTDPLHALSDGAQALTPQQFAVLAQKLRRVRALLETDR